MIFRIISYLKFLLSSSNHHGVHSPFIYAFVTKCLYNSTKYLEYRDILNYKTDLCSDISYIDISDFGAGSKVFNSNTRQVSKIAKYSGSSLKTAKLLFRVCNYFQPKFTLELGTSLGIGTYAMSIGYLGNEITSIEGCPNIAHRALQQLNAFKVKNVSIKIGTFNEVIPSLAKERFDVVFIDGHHSYDATLNSFKHLMPMTHNDSVFVFDDIYWSKSMLEAWEAIKSHPKVTVTVDCYHLGLVFFRSEQRKQHFKIRL